MKEGLDILYALQQKDDQLKEIEAIIKDIPLKIKELEDERDSRSDMIEKAKKKLHAQQRGAEKAGTRDRRHPRQDRQIQRTDEESDHQQGIPGLQQRDQVRRSQHRRGGRKNNRKNDRVRRDHGPRSAKPRASSRRSPTTYNQQIKDMRSNLEYHKNKLADENRRTRRNCAPASTPSCSRPTTTCTSKKPARSSPTCIPISAACATSRSAPRS